MSETGRGAGAARRLLAAILVSLAAWPAGVAAQGADEGPQPAPQPAPSAAPPQLDARAWILVDPRDGAVLAAHAANKPRAIASATKLMTAYVALKRLKPSRTLRAAPYTAGAAESLLGLRAGERMRVRDLLYGLILASGNDAAATLANGAAGSVPRFVEQMNRQAAALGLENTSFTNPVGLDAPGNYSSAADLAELASEALENELFARIADTATVTLRSGERPRRLSSRNTLLFEDPSVDGVKTGHTLRAGYVLVGSATRDGTQLVSAVLGAPSEAARDAETEELLDYGFSLYRRSTPVRQGAVLAEPSLDHRDESLPLVATRTVEVSARQGQPVEVEIDAPGELSGDVSEGQRLGSVTVTVDGRLAGASPLVASRSVAAATLADRAVAVAQDPAVLMPLGAIVILVGVLLAIRGRRSREPRRTAEERREMHEDRMRRRREGSGS